MYIFSLAICKELDEQGRMKYTQRYMQHSDISVYKHCISVAYTSVELAERSCAPIVWTMTDCTRMLISLKVER